MVKPLAIRGIKSVTALLQRLAAFAMPPSIQDVHPAGALQTINAAQAEGRMLVAGAIYDMDTRPGEHPGLTAAWRKRRD